MSANTQQVACEGSLVPMAIIAQSTQPSVKCKRSEG